MALNKVEICGVDTSKLPILKEEEKQELFRRIKAGDLQAKEEYIKEIEENYLNNKLKMILIQDELNLYRKDNKNAFTCLAEIQNILYNN